jgi:hypothetical protein
MLCAVWEIGLIISQSHAIAKHYMPCIVITEPFGASRWLTADHDRHRKNTISLSAGTSPSTSPTASSRRYRSTGRIDGQIYTQVLPCVGKKVVEPFFGMLLSSVSVMLIILTETEMIDYL